MTSEHLHHRSGDNRCMDHSGYVEKVEILDSRVRESVDATKRFHERIDAVFASINDLKDMMVADKQETTDKYYNLSTTITDQQNKLHITLLDLLQGEKGFVPRMNTIERNWNALVWVLIGLGSLSITMLTLFKTQIGKFAKWFFYG